MSRINEEIEVAVPVRVAYDQWTQFESFPRFMDGVDRVIQIDDKTLEWTATIAGAVKHWRAEITEQRPDERISWKTVAGDVQQAGNVSFERMDDTHTRITIQLGWEPEGLVEKAGSAVGLDTRQVKADAERFKQFIEDRTMETGAWRGEAGPHTPPRPTGLDPL